jgi:hypothetical protein
MSVVNALSPVESYSPPWSIELQSLFTPESGPLQAGPAATPAGLKKMQALLAQGLPGH